MFCLLLVVVYFHFFLARFIVFVSSVSICLACDSSIVATCPSIPAASFAFCSCFVRFILVLLFVVLSVEPKQNQGRGLVDSKLVNPPPPVISLLAVSWRLLCFGVLVILDVACLLMAILVIYEYKNR